MIGLVLVTHGRLAAEFITAMEHVVGPQQAVEGICIDAEDDMEMRRKEIADAIQRCDQGKGVIIPGVGNRVGAYVAHVTPRRVLLPLLARQHPALKT